MTEQFENLEESKLEVEAVSDTSAQQRIEQVAEKAAEKSTKAEQLYDKNNPIFSK
ncbi:MAG: hypothetical protein WAL75_15600 [Terracidiphilus sp.]